MRLEDNALIDERSLGDLREILPAGSIDALVNAYVTSTKALTEQILLAWQSGNWAEVARRAHDLRSTSSQVGAKGLAAKSKALETACIDRDHHAVANLVKCLEGVAAATCATISTMGLSAKTNSR